MSYFPSIYDSIASVPADDWNSVLVGVQDNPFMDLRLLRAAQDSLSSCGKLLYWMLRDDDQRPLACAALCVYRVDGALLAGGGLKRVTRAIRRFWPGYLRLNVLFCGLPLSAGQSHIAVHPAADPARVIQALDRTLLEVARGERTSIVVAKEFDQHEVAQFNALEQCGYVRLDSLNMNHFPPRFQDLDDYCGALRSHYRYKIKKSLRKMEQAGLIVEHLVDTARIVDLYDDSVHRLYEAVVERAEHKLEVLPIEFFRELASRLAGQVSLTIVRDPNRIVAFAWGLLAGQVYRNLFVGIDYSLNEDSDVYFNLMLRDIGFALPKGVSDILMGQTADEFKSRLGCYQTPRYIYLKSTNRALHWFIRSTASLAFPAPAPPPQRDLFKPAAPSQAAIATIP